MRELQVRDEDEREAGKIEESVSGVIIPHSRERVKLQHTACFAPSRGLRLCVHASVGLNMHVCI